LGKGDQTNKEVGRGGEECLGDRKGIKGNKGRYQKGDK